MITKSKFWKQIVSELKNIEPYEFERSKEITESIMHLIKDHPQNESKEKKA